jgi:glutathione S-transferase
MKLYYVVGSPNCRKVLSAINHLGIEVDIEYYDFFNGDLNTDKYLSINPNGKVPTLVDDSFKLWESNAIMQYLADQVPENTLFPKDPKTRADIVRWQCWELAHYNQLLGTIAFETNIRVAFNMGEPDHALVENAVGNLKQYASVLDKHLDNREYVVGDEITLADYSIIHIEAFKDTIPFDWSEFSNVNAYYDRMRNNPHWLKTAPESLEAIGHKPETA